ncbi:MAG: glycosyltransferase [Verrucomicrobia bacterium]|nr:glycosyltransferase [Verrucomicrobiota bacterium]
MELVIAENGSSDKTREVAEGLVSGRSWARVESFAQAGRGGALRRVWMRSAADVVSYMDVDLSANLAVYPALVGAVLEGGADIAIGSRLSERSRTRRGMRREVVSRGYNLLLRGLCGIEVRDAQCGFKAVKAEVFRRLEAEVKDDGWFFDTELLVRAQRAGCRIAELPVEWKEDKRSKVKVVRTICEDLRGMFRLWRGG